MIHLNQNWFSHMRKQPFVSMLQHYRTRLEAQLQSVSNPQEKKTGKNCGNNYTTWKDKRRLKTPIRYTRPFSNSPLIFTHG